MDGAKILAAGGTTASALTAAGGFTHSPTLVGVAGAVMLGANLLVLRPWTWFRRRRLRVSDLFPQLRPARVLDAK